MVRQQRSDRAADGCGGVVVLGQPLGSPHRAHENRLAPARLPDPPPENRYATLAAFADRLAPWGRRFIECRPQGI